jgi:phospholipid/cholesterol/gamma-HCH transport system substrate-binding protein
MEQDEIRRAVRVGIFIAIGLVIIVLGILTLGSLQKSFTSSIQIKAVFPDVNGLKKGNNIWFSGVKVGTISSLKFSGISSVLVEMKIEQSVQQYIHRDAGVKISSDGLIGNKILVIDGGNPAAPIIENGDVLKVENGISTEDMMKKLQSNNENLLSITENFKKISNRLSEGKGLVGSILYDTSLVRNFRALVNNLESTSRETLSISKEAGRFTAKMNQKNGLANQLFSDTVIYTGLRKSVNQLNEITLNADVLLKGLNKASDQLNSNHGTLGVLLNDEKEAEQTKKTLLNLNQSSIKLSEDLTAAQHNFLLRGYFKKKKKESTLDSLHHP